MLIRPAVPDDWPAIWPIWRRIAVAAETIAWPRDATYEWARDDWMLTDPVRTLVVLDGDTVVASAHLRPNYGRASRVASATFIVDPDRAGQGIGRRLVEYVLDTARADGFTAMVFNAVVETNASAIHLYLSLGFTILTTIPEAFDHPGHGPVGLHVMYLRL